jgi:hypothetical protein
MVTRSVGITGLVAALLAAAAGGDVLAQDREFAAGIGYGHLFWDGNNAGPLEEQGGLVFDARVTWAPTPRQPRLRVGVDLDLAFYFSTDDSDDDFSGVNDFAQLSVIAPALEVAWRHPIDEHWYLEPGLAGVLTIGNYTTGQELFGFVDRDENRWRVGGGGKTFLRLAYAQDRWAAGVEGSYTYGWLDFGEEIGGETRQAYVRLFYSRRF